jgi:predicted N-formylglutamate amidohydrolase
MVMRAAGNSVEIAAGEGEAFEVIGGSLAAGVILLCEHASNAIPLEYGALGLPRDELQRHIGYDIGARATTRAMAAYLRAPAILSRFSRLLIDPNRGADDPTLVMRIADGALVPGNARIDAAEIDRRLQRFYAPFHAEIERVIMAALAGGSVPALLSIHSMTPQMKGLARPWHVTLLWDDDPRLTMPFLAALQAEPDLVVADNEPYDGALLGDTIYQHATRRGLASTLIEFRQDLIAGEDQARSWGLRLAKLIEPLLQAPEVHEIKALTSRTGERMRRKKG